ncbi:MAG: hypothetical protein KME10_28700 [Plectolyngbya sp. WJT66-NPBG17]|nr:hypothetical protein [Plectolyngbya sp. WJT66-NPBG17]
MSFKLMSKKIESPYLIVFATQPRILRSRALLLAGAQQVGQKPTYRIHDLMHGLAKRLLIGSPEPEEKQDLPGLGLTLREAHAALLQRYRVQTQQELWHTLPDDGYIHGHLIWHLEQAGSVEKIHVLLQERTATGQNGWFVACEALGQTANFVKGVARAWQWADQQCETNPVGAIYWQCRYLLIYGSLNSLASNIPPELIAALVEKGFWKPDQGLAYVQQIPEARRRADAIATILPHLPEELMGEVLAVTREIQDESARAPALCALVPYLPEELMSEALAVIRAIRPEFVRASALCASVPHLPESLLNEPLECVKEMRDPYHKAKAFQGFTQQLTCISTTPRVWSETLHVFSALHRYELMTTLANLTSFLLTLGGNDALQEMLRAMREVCQEWQ